MVAILIGVGIFVVTYTLGHVSGFMKGYNLGMDDAEKALEAFFSARIKDENDSK